MTRTPDHRSPRLRRLWPATAGAAGLLLAATAPAHASYTHSTDDFEFDLDGLCPFTRHIAVHNEGETATHRQGGREVHGLPYHFSVRYTDDADGNTVDETGNGEIWRFQLPDGGIWSAGGRATDFRNGVYVGSWQISDGLGPVCDALVG